jgi:hypothetical protein
VSRWLKMEAIRSSETFVYTGTTWHHIPENGILHSHRREDLTYYTDTLIPSVYQCVETRRIEVF